MTNEPLTDARHAYRKQMYKKAIRAAILGLVVNFCLGVIKLIAGVMTLSFALIADAVNSIGDAITSVVVVLALIFAQKPPDREHPYGHSRAEAIAGSNVAVLIILSALLVGYEAIARLGLSSNIPPWWTLIIAGSNVVIKEVLYHYKRSVAKRVGSEALLANAWDHRGDALCSLAVMIGLAVVMIGGEGFTWADNAAALVVVIAILWTGFQLLRCTNAALMDQQAHTAVVEDLRQCALQLPGVDVVEKLRMRKSGLEYFVEIHLHVDPRMQVDAAHELGHRVKDALMEHSPMIGDVLVHLEPTSNANDSQNT